MAVSSSEVSYLRFVLRPETDGILMARRRSASLPLPVPETREIKALLRILVGHGIEKVRLSGGDPAQRKDLSEVVGMVADLDGVHEVAMTTGGVGLDGRINELAEQGLHSINFDIDTLNRARYKKLTGSDGFRKAWDAVDEALDAGLKTKLNVVLRRGVNGDEIKDFVALAKRKPLHVRFVEWNACANIIAPPERFLSTREVMSAVKLPLAPLDPVLRDGPALVYTIPGYVGTVGFIPNITEHFCSSCNRIGLTDLGDILSCIFGRGLSLARHLRSPDGTRSVTAYVERVMKRKLLLASKLGDIPGLVIAAEPAGATPASG